MNLPTILTLIRILAIPVFVFVFYLPVTWGRTAAAIIFLLAAFTDWLDGYLARYLGQTTPFGAFLDPVADKIFVATALVIIIGQNPIPFLAIPAAIIIGREIVVSALREWMAELGKRTNVAVSKIAKIKTAVQMFAVVILMIYKPGAENFHIGPVPVMAAVGLILLWAAAILTLWSMVIYLKAAWIDLTLSAEKE